MDKNNSTEEGSKEALYVVFKVKEISGFLDLFRDVSDRNKTEEALYVYVG